MQCITRRGQRRKPCFGQLNTIATSGLMERTARLHYTLVEAVSLHQVSLASRASTRIPITPVSMLSQLASHVDSGCVHTYSGKGYCPLVRCVASFVQWCIYSIRSEHVCQVLRPIPVRARRHRTSNGTTSKPSVRIICESGPVRRLIPFRRIPNLYRIGLS